MARVVRPEPQSANDYDDRTTAAVRSVLIELGQILGSFRTRFAVIGGSVPCLLLRDAEMTHVGTLDVDLGLDAEALGEGQYATMIETLLGNRYEQRPQNRTFQLVRRVPASDGGDPIDVIVDFLMPREAEITKNRPPLVPDFAVQRADSAGLAVLFHEMIELDGPMPEGGTNRVQIAVCSIPAFLAMKGYALDGRLKRKDSYDIYYCIRNYPGGIDPLIDACRLLLDDHRAMTGYRFIDAKFGALDGYGPTSVQKFVSDSAIAGDRTPDQWQRDAYGLVDEWLRGLGIRR
jgi:hypothetical protein